MNAGYPSVNEAGFHHCALIYEGANRRENDFRPYIAKIENDMATPVWGFDAFLFLTHNVRGMNTEIGELNMADFQMIIEQYFSPGIYLDALDKSIEKISEELNENPPAKRKIIIVIPWLNPAVTEFGVINGKKISLARQRGKDMAVSWYVNQVKERFENRFNHLELWGFYWMRENISSTPKVVQSAAKIIHNANLKLLWIPYYLATGYADWRKYGVDVAVMQSNYVFNCADTGGNARSNRIVANASRCKQFGMGFEIELYSSVNPSPDRQYFFLKSLEQGGKKYLGYQHVPTAYYLGGSLEFSRSTDQEMRKTYHALCDYIAGKQIEVARPDVWSIEKSGSTITAFCKLPNAIKCGNVDIFFTEVGNRWLGTGRVFGKKDEQWVPIGWAVRATPNFDELQYQSLTIPLEGEFYEFKLELSEAENLDVTNIVAELDVPPVNWSASCQEETDIEQLNSAINNGTLKAYHTFYGQHTEIVRSYAISAPVLCDTIQVATTTEFDAAALMLGNHFDFCATNGTGSLPETMLVAGKLTRGFINFKLQQQVQIEKFALALRFSKYSTLGEIRFMLNGKRVQSGEISSRGYRGTINMGGEYYDDGVVSSTGVVHQMFNGMIGWKTRGEKVITMKLEQRKMVSKIIIGVFSAVLQKVEMPEEIAVSVSSNGENWTPYIKAFMPVNIEKRNLLRLLQAEAVIPEQNAEFVRVKVRSGSDLTLIKYIEALD